MGTIDAFQRQVWSPQFKQNCFPHRSKMGVLKSFPKIIGLFLPLFFLESYMLRKFMRGALYVAFAMVALWIIVNVIAMAKYALS